MSDDYMVQVPGRGAAVTIMANHNVGQVAQVCICHPGLCLASPAGQKRNVLQPGRAREQTGQHVLCFRFHTW